MLRSTGNIVQRLVQKVWVYWILATLLACGFMGYALTADRSPAKRIFLPGKTTHGHYQIELDCHACHTTSFEMKQDACVGCHVAELKQCKDTHPATKFIDPVNAQRLKVLDATNCLTCHKEHVPERTYPMGLSLPTDYCYHCHTTIFEDRPSHQGFAFNSCQTAGCHNYHDNRALYENILVKHFGEPDVLENPHVPSRDYHDWLKSRKQLGSPLTAADQDSKLPADEITTALAGWLKSSHSTAGVNCSGCHQPPVEVGDTEVPQTWSESVALDVCSGCHKPEAEGWLGGLHGMRVADNFPPMQVCDARLPMKSAAAHRLLTCNSCHPAHQYDTHLAAVQACLECHNDDHSLAYTRSSHFELWTAETNGKSPAGSGVSCATCHMPREEGAGRIVVNHNQNANLEPNEKMVRSVCMNCHGLEFSIDALADPQLINKCFEGSPAKHIESAQMAKDWFDRKQRERQERLNRRNSQ
ncbi:ammonia-forming cytochrome c nitrite reductase subunit c552 [bacterium]|nr:ammonia-forming cytochrome c nitrite reductase subunit c552 [bacterium]